MSFCVFDVEQYQKFDSVSHKRYCGYSKCGATCQVQKLSHQEVSKEREGRSGRPPGIAIAYLESVVSPSAYFLRMFVVFANTLTKRPLALAMLTFIAPLDPLTQEIIFLHILYYLWSHLSC